jgi:hypothetical protein
MASKADESLLDTVCEDAIGREKKNIETIPFSENNPFVSRSAQCTKLKGWIWGSESPPAAMTMPPSATIPQRTNAKVVVAPGDR